MNAGADLPALDAIRALAPEMLATRHQIHANPELGFEEFKTSDLVAERLARLGLRGAPRPGRHGRGGHAGGGRSRAGDGQQRYRGPDGARQGRPRCDARSGRWTRWWPRRPS